ncbi:hypothetical protein [Undibacterium fentianense]|uniref:Membrane bound FAD containing D-sorbitol dehydrogenase n=1 Tax=Undibacterium fentianense TaxID=2828728 RepID=A0A941E2Z3_9BURK|nr:hypothetical protein [Undibacterium fentianense]MBR7800272.1 hypothetical protein [Undibacterium fentianense]
MSTMGNDQEIFLQISVELTGFNSAELLGTGMLETYFATVQEGTTKENLGLFLQASAEILSETDVSTRETQIANLLMPDSSYLGLAKNIIYMWYSGQWGPTVNSPDANLQEVRNISPEAYVQGLMWTAANTHPPGAKQPGFGSWAMPPIRT